MRRYAIIFGLAAVVLLLDQGSKRMVEQALSLHESVSVTSFFNLVHVRNYGAAFGILNDPSGTWQFWLFLAATLLAVCVLMGIARAASAKETPLFLALGLLLGGAVGNLIDRIKYRAVVDFLDFYLYGWHWPAFNVADIAICLGAGLTALLLLYPARGRRA